MLHRKTSDQFASLVCRVQRTVKREEGDDPEEAPREKIPRYDRMVGSGERGPFR